MRSQRRRRADSRIPWVSLRRGADLRWNRRFCAISKIQPEPRIGRNEIAVLDAPSLGWFLVPRGTGLQFKQFNNPTSIKNKKYDNSTLKKINRPLTLATRLSSHHARALLLCACAGPESLRG